MKQLNWYQIFGNTHTIPEGSTVTPTDDVQILLHCANIWDKSYTTIGEVIADDDTLFLTLIDNNAIDYLVRSTTFASSIVADEESMEYIGASDYASETLLSDSTWNTAIDGSSYKDYVVNAKVPKMTSNTTPSGIVSASGQYPSTTHVMWHMFDDDLTDEWQSNANANPTQWIQYQFTYPVKIYRFSVYGISGSLSMFRAYKGKIQTSEDGTNFVDASEVIESPYNSGWRSELVTPPYASKYWRMQTVQNNYNSGSDSRTILRELQLYGRAVGGVQSWLKAGGITNKKYTTVSEVLSDLTTLATLMASTDAIDYLVTAKGWATEICSDSNAMADIGMNNYAANTLLADETWCNAIANSAYIESVLNVKVPAMTDNTHPYGEVTASSVYNPRSAWYAFDMDNTTWWAGASPTNSWIGYSFTSPVKVVAVKAKPATGQDANQFPKNVKVQYSTDGNTYSDAKSSVFAMGVENTVAFNNTSAIQHWRLFCVDNYGAGLTTSIGTLQFYGRKDI